jgi:hypothetical protein
MPSRGPTEPPLSFATLLVSESRRVLRKTTWWWIAGLGIFSFFLVSQYQLGASRNLAVARADRDFYAAGATSEVCQAIGEASVERCARLAQRAVRDQERWILELNERFLASPIVSSPEGAPGLAAGLLATSPGWVLILGACCVHVASEWSTGYARVRFARDTRRGVFVAAKVVSMMLFALIVLIAWSLTIAVGAFLTLRGMVTPVGGGLGTPATYSIRHLVGVVPVVYFLAALGCCVAVWVRSAVGSLLTLTLVVSVTVIAAAVPLIAPFSPATWVERVMSFTGETQLADHLWIDVGAGPGPFLAAGMLVAGASALCVAATLRLRLSPLDE